MDSMSGFGRGLPNLALLSDAETRSVNAENPTGERAGGAKATPGAKEAASDLGQGWKVRPCLTLDPSSVTTLADVKGPGVIQHIWITVPPNFDRELVLRFYWDGEAQPSVEVPVGDFFCCGHNRRCLVNALPVVVNPVGGFNCYWPMPFVEGARVTVENPRAEALGGFFYQITYAQTEIPEKAARFHAQWRRSTTTREVPEHTLVDGIQGQGHYVGTFLAWSQFSNGWWGEGEAKFYIDGDGDFPTICGTGTEDYFGGAWGFGGQTYSTAFLGYPMYEKPSGEVPRHGLYRFHVLDPIRFKQDLRVTIQALGWWPNGKFQPLTDDIASVAYWYQTEPHVEFPALPGVSERWGR